MAAGLVERDRERLAHVRHHREVQQPGDIHLVVQPARIDPVVVREQLGQFPTGGGLVDLAAAGRLGHRDLGLLLDPVPLEPTFGAPLVGHRHRPDAAADHPAQRKDQPPEFPAKCNTEFIATRMPPVPERGHPRHAPRSNLVPTPSSSARATTSSAVARSCNPTPIDSNKVMSSSEDRPSCAPTMTPPSSVRTSSSVMAPSAIALRSHVFGVSC